MPFSGLLCDVCLGGYSYVPMFPLQCSAVNDTFCKPSLKTLDLPFGEGASTPSVCFSCFFLYVFFPTVSVPSLFWFGSVFLVATAGFVAGQLIMWDKQQQRVRFCFVCLFCCFLCFLPGILVSPVWVLLLFYF